MKPIDIYDENQCYIFLSKNLTFHAYIKHITIHHHLAWKKIKDGFIKLIYYNIEYTVVNTLTKKNSIAKHEHF
jgi:hypothetical protein